MEFPSPEASAEPVSDQPCQQFQTVSLTVIPLASRPNPHESTELTKDSKRTAHPEPEDARERV